MKCPNLVLVIEWQFRWLICVWCEIHGWLVPRYTSVSNTKSHDGEVAWLCCKCSTSALEELIAYETWHDVMWLGGEDQEAWLGYEGPSCKCEGKAKGSGAMDRQGGEARVESFGTDGPRQRWRASEAAIDEPIRSHDDMKLIISFKRDQAKCWFVLMIKWLDGEWWRNFMLWTMMKGSMVGYTYGWSFFIIWWRWRLDACVASPTKEMKWNAQGKGIFVGHFISPVKG
jgi:hypothetical protein